MNSFQTQLYADLLKLTQEEDDFSARDFPQADGTMLRIFSYRLGSYSKFLLPNALNCRGTLFHVAADGSPIALLALPMEKFFGNEENPMTQKIDFSPENIVYAANKLDGSLISTYIDPFSGGLKVKSKNSVGSKEVAAATALLNTDKFEPLRDMLLRMTLDGYTVDLEYTGPGNRIVLGYDEPALAVLSMRDCTTGLSGLPEDFYEHDEALCRNIAEFTVKLFAPSEVIRIMAEMDGYDNFEGLVICVKHKGKVLRVKHKSVKYDVLHHAGDAVNFVKGVTEARRIVNCVVYGKVDDLKAILATRDGYADKPEIFAEISAIEAQVVPKFNAMIAAVERFVAENAQLDKAAFAKAGQAIADGFFSLKMMKYLGKEIDYETFAMKNTSLFYRPASAEPVATVPA